MPTADLITNDFIRYYSADTSALANGKKISLKDDFFNLCRSADNTLIFGECKGSGAFHYSTSVDLIGNTPVFRCSCPSRQRPCKHAVALMLDYVAGKTFTVKEVPEDIERKRNQIMKKNNTNNTMSKEPTVKKQKAMLSAATKKLQKQLEGLDLAENFVRDIFSRGISSVSSISSAQYKTLAKQLGDYYLSRPQGIILEIIKEAEKLSAEPEDEELKRVISLCVTLSSTIKKGRAYINEKLESGEVLAEDNVLFEAMGGVWKLTQLKDAGLYKANAVITQLSFTVLHDEAHHTDIDFGYWIDLESGEISCTENIRPQRAVHYITAEDSSQGIFHIPELCIYPGGINRRIRWNTTDITDVTDVTDISPQTYSLIVSKAETSLADTVKRAKNELKNSMSSGYAAFLIAYDAICVTDDYELILKHGDETIGLRHDKNYPQTVNVLSLLNGKYLRNGAMLGEIFYDSNERKLFLCPITVINEFGITRLC